MDYGSGDYLRVMFRNYEGVVFMGSVGVRSGLAGVLLTAGNGTSVGVSVVNDTVIDVTNISRINGVGIVNEITLIGLPNPAAIYPINNASAY